MTMTSAVCAKCGGQIMADPERPWCFQCGESPLTAEARKAWWVKHKADMKADVKVLTYLEFKKKWHVPKEGYALLWRTGAYKQRAVKAPEPAVTILKEPRTTVVNGFHKLLGNGLPPFPAFDSTWQPLVQERWLDVYMRLKTSDKGKEADHEENQTKSV